MQSYTLPVKVSLAASRWAMVYNPGRSSSPMVDAPPAGYTAGIPLN